MLSGKYTCFREFGQKLEQFGSEKDTKRVMFKAVSQLMLKRKYLFICNHLSRKQKKKYFNHLKIIVSKIVDMFFNEGVLENKKMEVTK